MVQRVRWLTVASAIQLAECLHRRRRLQTGRATSVRRPTWPASSCCYGTSTARTPVAWTWISTGRWAAQMAAVKLKRTLCLLPTPSKSSTSSLVRGHSSTPVYTAVCLDLRNPCNCNWFLAATFAGGIGGDSVYRQKLAANWTLFLCFVFNKFAVTAQVKRKYTVSQTPNSCPQLRQKLTDFQTFFTDGLGSKFEQTHV